VNTMIKTLAYWKERAVTVRQMIEEFVGSAAHLKELKGALKHAYRRIEQIERRVLVCVVLLVLLLVQGCQLAKGGLRDIGCTANKLADNITGEQEQE